MRLLLTGERAVFGSAGCAGCRSRITWCVSPPSTVGQGGRCVAVDPGKLLCWRCWTLPGAVWGRMGRQIDGWMEQQQQEGGWETSARFRVSSARCSTTPTWRTQELPRSGLQGLPHTAITRRLIRGFPAHEMRERARAPRPCCCFIDVSLFNASWRRNSEGGVGVLLYCECCNNNPAIISYHIISYLSIKQIIVQIPFWNAVSLT